MSIFSKIKDAIFGKKAQAAAPETPAVAPAAPVAAPEPAAMEDVDVEAQLSAMQGADGLNWRSSIVDLFKLLGLDSSYENRKELAQELDCHRFGGPFARSSLARS